MQDKVEKYEAIKKLGKVLFTQSNVVKTGKVAQEDIETVKQFLTKAITAVNPEVLASYFEHVIIAPELGRRITKEIEVRGLRFEVNKDEVEFLLWLHEIGRLVDPGGYLRNDLIDEHLLIEFGLAKSLIQNLPPIRTFLQVGKMLELENEQIHGEKNLNSNQEKIISDYFNLFTPTQRIIFLADNFGKRNEDGKLFNLQTLLSYIRMQEDRYKDEDEKWISVRRPAGAILAIKIIEKTIEWLEGLGIDFENILNSLQDYGPKFIIVSRHGELYNPNNIVYNRDEVMKPGDVIHLSDYGREQMKILGELIQKRKFRVDKIVTSPSVRAVESGNQFNLALNVDNDNIASDRDLDDVYAPGGYVEGMSMDEFKKMGGVAYDNRWKKYHHENIESVWERMKNVFWELAKNLHVGQAGIIVSHGDPIAIFIQTIISREMPRRELLRKGLYPDKGEAIIAIIGPKGEWFTHYILTDPSLKKGKQY